VTPTSASTSQRGQSGKIQRGLVSAAEDLRLGVSPMRLLAEFEGHATRTPVREAAPEASVPQLRLQGGGTGSPAASTKSRARFIALAAGAGGIAELRGRLDNATVSWALVRCQLGIGMRPKMVLVHASGKNTPPVMQGRLNALGPTVAGLLGEVHATLTITSASELTTELLCEVLQTRCPADLRRLSLQTLKREYSLAVVQQAAGAEQRKQATLREQGGTLPTADEVLDDVADSHGRLNWVAIDPAGLELHNAGQGGFDEMKADLAEDKVLFCVVRFSFSTTMRQTSAPSLRQAPQNNVTITKHVFFHWIGARVPTVRRGLWNAKLCLATKMISRHCSLALRREVHRLEDLQMEELIPELRSITRAEGVALGQGPAPNRISVGDYYASLREEARRHAVSRPLAPLPDLKEAIEVVRKSDGTLNWVLCGCSPESIRAPPPSRGGC